MEVEVSYTFNASALGGKDLVTFEELYDLSNPDEPIKVAEHKDIEDEGQTVTIEERVIEIHTNAVDKATGEKMIVAGKEVTVIDTVTLDGLEKGTTYQLKGWQMVKSENAQLLIGGEPVESDYTFTAKDSSMEVQIAFTFNASELAGKDLVTFEELYDLSNPDEPTKVAEHKDIEDEGQTVTITERIITMHTIATDKATGEKTIEVDDKVTIVDRLKISGVEIRLRELGRRIDLERIHPHKFRRTMATRAIDKGMPIEQVQKILGHSQIDTTMQYAMVNQNNVKTSHQKYMS